DARFTSNPDRVRNRDAIDALIEGVMKSQPTAHWERVLTAAGVPIAPVRSIAETLEHPQTRAIGMVQPVPQSQMHLTAAPMRFDGVRPTIRSKAPALGANNSLLDEYRST